MKDLLSSATKIVFLLVAITICLGFFFDKITNEQFIGIAMLVMSFYYVRNA
jgi:hypothetical protein